MPEENEMRDEDAGAGEDAGAALIQSMEGKGGEARRNRLRMKHVERRGYLEVDLCVYDATLAEEANRARMWCVVTALGEEALLSFYRHALKGKDNFVLQVLVDGSGRTHYGRALMPGDRIVEFDRRVGLVMELREAHHWSRREARADLQRGSEYRHKRVRMVGARRHYGIKEG